jgi:DNA-binding transcriptional LysR family regulator
VELRHLRYFLAVADELHFGRAAKQLNISQPPLSQQILQLEEELGVKLFKRNKRQVQLTWAGQMFAEEARSILTQVDHARTVAVQANQGQIGQLTIGSVLSVDSLVHRTLVKILQTYTKHHPHVRLALRSLTTPQQIEALHIGRLDVGFLTANLAHDPVLASEPVRREQLMLALPRGNPLSRRRSVSMHALAAEPFIMLSRNLAPAYHDLIVAWFRDQGFSVNTAYESDNLFSSLTLVECGIGVAFLPAALKGLTRDVIFRDVQAKLPGLELFVAYRRDSQSEVLRSFLAVVRETVAK